MRSAVSILVALLGMAALAQAQEPVERWSDDRAFLEQALHPRRLSLWTPDRDVLLAALLPGGRQVLVVTIDGLVVRALPTGMTLGRKRLSLTPRAVVALAPSGRFLAIADKIGGLRLWRLQSGPPWFEAAPRLEVARSLGVAFSADERALLVAHAGGCQVRTIAADGRLGEPRVESLGLTPDTLAMAGDGLRLFGRGLGMVYAWSLGAGARLEGASGAGQALVEAAGAPWSNGPFTRPFALSLDDQWVAVQDLERPGIRILRATDGGAPVSARLPLPEEWPWIPIRALHAGQAGLVAAGDERLEVWRGREPWKVRDPVAAVPRFEIAAVASTRVSGAERASEMTGPVGGSKALLYHRVWHVDAATAQLAVTRVDLRPTYDVAAISSRWVLLAGKASPLGGAVLQLWRGNLPEPELVQRLWTDAPANALAISPGEDWAIASIGTGVRLFSLDPARDPPLEEVEQLDLTTSQAAMRGFVSRPRLPEVRADALGAWVELGAVDGGVGVCVRVVSRAGRLELVPPADPEPVWLGRLLDVERAGDLELVQQGVRDPGQLHVLLRPTPGVPERDCALPPLLRAWFTNGGTGILGIVEAPLRSLVLFRLPFHPRPVRIGATDAIDWRWTQRPRGQRPQLRATLAAPRPGALDLTVEHMGGDPAFLLRGLLRTAPNAEPVWVALGTIEPGTTLTRHLTGAAPAEGATLELADQWGRLEPIALEGP